MDALSATIPWSTPALWQEANASLAHAVSKHAPAMAGPFAHARRIRHGLEALFPLMDALCRETCPDCTDVCCRRAWVYTDFRDLLFCHLADVPPPDDQLIGTAGSHCRFAGPGGCRLERIRRPFVCTWYTCPAQTALLDNRLTAKQCLTRILQQIKSDRKRMEASFIQAVA